MRPIKFRARTLDGRIVYGEFSQERLGTYIDFKSLAQLGDVIDGVEYYEGDERIIDGRNHVCSLAVQWEAKA